jgi:hypothetical protein
MDLIATIEADLKAAGHEVDQIAHDVLTKHLTLSNIAAHVAASVAAVQDNPLAQTLEKAALPPGAVSIVTHLADELAAFLGAAAAPAPAAATA